MFTLNCKGRLITIDTPITMGVINTTPDSFYQGSRFNETGEILRKVEQMLIEEADLIDIGGQSTRPGSEPISAEAELKRVVTVVEAISQRFPMAVISVDTYFSVVAKECVAAGASMVNDISSGTFDSKMIATVATMKVPYIITHMKGTPQTMMQYTSYTNVVRDVFDFLVQKREECRRQGIDDVIIDPGFGFAKTIPQNFQLLKSLSLFNMIEAPLLVGLSRKSSIYKTLGITPADALNGTTVLNTIALMQGAHILRVHDPKEAREVIRLYDMLHDVNDA